MGNKEKILESFSGELRRGTLVLSVLSQLKQPAYGYTLVQQMKQKGLEIEQNTLYPLLRRLEKQDILDSFWKLEDGRQRRYYKLSAFGGEVLEELAKEWTRTVQTVGELLEKEGLDHGTD